MVDYNVVQSAAVYNPTVSTTSVQILPDRTGGKIKRTQLYICNGTASPNTTKFTVMKGDSAVVANQGYQLNIGAAFLESNDGGATCWQGAVQAIASDANGSIVIVESFEVVQ